MNWSIVRVQEPAKTHECRQRSIGTPKIAIVHLVETCLLASTGICVPVSVVISTLELNQGRASGHSDSNMSYRTSGSSAGIRNFGGRASYRMNDRRAESSKSCPPALSCLYHQVLCREMAGTGTRGLGQEDT